MSLNIEELKSNIKIIQKNILLKKLVLQKTDTNVFFLNKKKISNKEFAEKLNLKNHNIQNLIILKKKLLLKLFNLKFTILKKFFKNCYLNIYKLELINKEKYLINQKNRIQSKINEILLNMKNLNLKFQKKNRNLKKMEFMLLRGSII